MKNTGGGGWYGNYLRAQLCKLQMLLSLKHGAEASGTVLCLSKWQKDNVIF